MMRLFLFLANNPNPDSCAPSPRHSGPALSCKVEGVRNRGSAATSSPVLREVGLNICLCFLAFLRRFLLCPALSSLARVSCSALLFLFERYRQRSLNRSLSETREAKSIPYPRLLLLTPYPPHSPCLHRITAVGWEERLKKGHNSDQARNSRNTSPLADCDSQFCSSTSLVLRHSVPASALGERMALNSYRGSSTCTLPSRSRS